MLNFLFLILNRGPLDCARQIWRAEGIRGIFRGLNITIVREIPAFGLYFSSYEAMTRRQDATKPLSTIHMMTAGGCAGICSWLFTYPIDFLKSRLQVSWLITHTPTSAIVDYNWNFLLLSGTGGWLGWHPCIQWHLELRHEDLPRWRHAWFLPRHVFNANTLVSR